MPSVYLQQDNEYRDISNFVGKIKWSGSKTEAARKLELSLINGVLDSNIPNLYIKNGSILKLFEDNGKLLFKGFVFFYERSGKHGDVGVTAYDHLIYTLKNKATYNFKNKTAEEITAIICQDFQITKGNIATTGIKQSFISSKQSVYNSFMKAYTHASKKNGKQYLPRIRDGKLDVIEIGSVTCAYTLHDEGNILDSSYSESIENMVNRVKIYDSKDKYVGVVENIDWIKRYGVLQDIYTKGKDKEVHSVAKGMLQDGIKRTDVEALGNIECVTGNAVKLHDTGTALTGLFYIDSDTHTWSNGQHIMRVGLNFKKMMDERG